MNLELILNYLETIDFNDCIRNCSNNGLCKVSNRTNLICECEQFYEGKECEINKRPCFSHPCLNNGKCVENLDDLTFDCNCTDLYFGTYCENKLDVCSNETCSNNGICQDRENLPECDCFYLYEGEKCEIISAQLKTIKSVISITSIIAILILIMFCLLICSMDLFKLCTRKRRRRRRKIIIRKLKYIDV